MLLRAWPHQSLIVPGTCRIPAGASGPPCVVTWSAEIPGGLDVPQQFWMKVRVETFSLLSHEGGECHRLALASTIGPPFLPLLDRINESVVASY